MLRCWVSLLSAAAPLLIFTVLIDQVAGVGQLPPEPSAAPKDWSGANYYGYGSCAACWKDFATPFDAQTVKYCNHGGLPDRCRVYRIVSKTIATQCACPFLGH